jgi:hypothetical protein
VSQNALKHGLYAHASFFWEAAIALGEDPRHFQRLLKGLVEARRPADTLEMVLVEDIAWLIWKKVRLDRTETAVQVRNLQKHDLERRKLCVQVGREISDTSEFEVREKGLRTTLDAPGKFEQVFSFFYSLVEMVEKNEFSYYMQEALRALYGTEPTLRGAALYTYYFKLSKMKPSDPGFEEAKNLMTARLAEEIAEVAQEYELFLHEYVENTRAARVAATAPSQAQWAAIIRQQNALHRQLERKIRLLEEMQEKRKREEERFPDNYEASLRRNPPEAPRGGGQRVAQTSRAAKSAALPRRESSQGAALPRTQVSPTPALKSAALPRCESLKAAARQRTQVGATPASKSAALPRRECSQAAALQSTQVGATREVSLRRNPSDGARGGGRASDRKKILNRGNKLKDLLKTKGLSENTAPKQTPFCTKKIAIKAKKRGI